MCKYYTPDISEFHVGFEYEEAVIDCKTWHSRGEWESAIFKIDTGLKVLEDYPQWTRVKYLDGDDIESLGFCKDEFYVVACPDYILKGYSKLVREQFGGNYGGTGIYLFIEEIGNKYKIHKLYTYGDGSANDVVMFYGEIKNKSEFKKILIQIDEIH